MKFFIKAELSRQLFAPAQRATDELSAAEADMPRNLGKSVNNFQKSNKCGSSYLKHFFLFTKEQRDFRTCREHAFTCISA